MLYRLVFLLGLLTCSARAESSRLLLVDPDPGLERAVRAAFDGWDTPLVVESTGASADTRSKSLDSARALAKQRRAGSVVWISPSGGGFGLHFYDAQTDRVIVRPVTRPPPYDDATAASVALSIKTLLRHRETQEPRARPTEMKEYWLHVAAAAGMRSTATVPREAEARFGVGASALSPSPVGPLRLGLGVDVTSGPGLDVEAPSFTGRWRETVALFTVRALLRLPSAVDLGFAIGAGFDVTSLEGRSVRSNHVSREGRVNGVAAGHMEVAYRLGPRFRLALRPGLVHAFSRQAYFADGEAVIRMEPLMLSIMAVLEVGLF